MKAASAFCVLHASAEAGAESTLLLAEAGECC